MLRKPLLIACAIALLMSAYWIGFTAGKPTQTGSMAAQSVLDEGSTGKEKPTNSLIEAGGAGGLVLYEPARAGSIKTILDNAPGTTGKYTSITIGADGLPLISYQDESNDRLKVAHCSNINCTAATITTINSPAQHTAITLGSDGLGIIAFYDPILGNLKVAHCTNVLCTSSTVLTLDSNSITGQYPSIDVNNVGRPIISYYDALNGNLKFANCLSITCSSANLLVIDSVGNVGQFTSLTRRIDGMPIMSYYDATNTHLKIAGCNSFDCSFSVYRITVDNDDNTGQMSSIAIGSDGKPIISYVEVDGSTFLRIGHCAYYTCDGFDHIEKNYISGTGVNTSIAIGLDGKPVVSHYNQTNKTLNVAHCHTVDCSIIASDAIDSGNVGSNTSITIGIDGMPIMSYYDAGNFALRTLHCGSPSCEEFIRRR